MPKNMQICIKNNHTHLIATLQETIFRKQIFFEYSSGNILVSSLFPI